MQTPVSPWDATRGQSYEVQGQIWRELQYSIMGAI